LVRTEVRPRAALGRAAHLSDRGSRRSPRRVSSRASAGHGATAGGEQVWRYRSTHPTKRPRIPSRPCAPTSRSTGSARTGTLRSSCAADIRSTSSRARSASISTKLDWLAPAARAQAQLRYGVVEPSTTDPITSMAWRTGLLMSVLDEHLRDHSEVHVAQHEYLCDAPVERMRDLVTSIGLRGHPPPRASSPSTNGRVRASSSTGWRPSSRASGAPVCPTTTRAARRA
jgi:hypothetical protein